MIDMAWINVSDTQIFSLNCQKEIIKMVLGGFGVGSLKYKCLISFFIGYDFLQLLGYQYFVTQHLLCAIMSDISLSV